MIKIKINIKMIAMAALTTCLMGCTDKKLSDFVKTSTATTDTTSNTTITPCTAGTYCVVFITTNNLVNGDLDGSTNDSVTGDNDGANGIEEADAICNGDANKPTTNSYKAFIVDGTNRVACTTPSCGGGNGEHTDWVLQASREYRQSDKSTVIGTTTAVGLFTFALTNSFGTTTLFYRTGMGTDYTTGTHCTKWTDLTVGVSGKQGTFNVDTNGALSSGTPTCNITTLRLLCIEQP